MCAGLNQNDKTEITTLHKCLICGKAWNNKQSLYAHCKVHKKGELARTTIKMEAEQLEKLKEICKKHNTTTCHLFKALGEAVIAGDKSGAGISIGSANPFIINVFHQFFGKPRSQYKFEKEPMVIKRPSKYRSLTEEELRRGYHYQSYIEKEEYVLEWWYEKQRLKNLSKGDKG
jgi:hypothetical protein